MSSKKLKTQYVCQSCGTVYVKWQGQCSSCREWNTIVEEIVEKKSTNLVGDRKKITEPQLIKTITNFDFERLVFYNEEFNRVLGGGLVPGSITLIAGEPGIGKSTFLLDLALKTPDKNILYVSGEESPQQIKMRADRIGIHNELCYIFCETNIETILQYAIQISPAFLVIDSVQTIYTNILDSPAGSIGQIRECTALLQQFAKQYNVPVFLIGHVTKDGYIAGPKVLEHIVDTVLSFEGDRHYGYRILRSLKNRFGSTNELGIFEMTNNGLIPVLNPSDLFITHRDENVSGSSIVAVVEGIRPLLVEVQALVSPSPYGQPQRSATGFDSKRMAMLLAVLEKKAGLRLSNQDVFINITGGVRIEDTAMDLGVIAAIMSSAMDLPIDKNICFAGEVGLSGEIRPVSRLEQRIAEATKLMFNSIVVSKYNFASSKPGKQKINILLVSNVYELFKLLFE